MKTTVDKDLCLGCGLCVDICPEVFQMEEDKAVAKAEQVPQGPRTLAGMPLSNVRSRQSRLKSSPRAVILSAA